MADFLKSNFPSLRGRVSEKEREFLKKSIPTIKDKELFKVEPKAFKGAISEAELDYLKKLLP